MLCIVQSSMDVFTTWRLRLKGQSFQWFMGNDQPISISFFTQFQSTQHTKNNWNYFSYVKTFTTTTLAFTIGIRESELTAQISFFPIHNCSYNTEKGHWLNKYVYTMSWYSFLTFHSFKGIVMCIWKSITSSSFNPKPYTMRPFCIWRREEFKHSFSSTWRDGDRVLPLSRSCGFWFRGCGRFL